MADVDIRFRPTDVEALLRADKPIVGAIYFGVNPQTNKSFPTVLRKSREGPFIPMNPKHLPKKGCIPVDAVGMGCTLVQRPVLEALGADHNHLWPFAETEIDGRAVGEDLAFCLRAKEAGFDTWVCGDARVGHAKTFLING